MDRRTRAQLEAEIERIAYKRLVRGHYVDSDLGEPYWGADFCFEHANMVARISALETSTTTWVSSSSMGVDGHRHCEFRGCHRHLDFGGLTDYGVRDALGLNDDPKNPLNVHVYPSELALAARYMGPNDPHWPLWEQHARHVLKRHRRCS